MKKEIDLLRFPRVEREIGKRTEKHRAVARRFDKEFFDGSRNTGYGGYKYDGRWRAVALRMMLHYGLVEGVSRVLDVGCAKGFLVRDLRDRGIQAYGIDVSEYALSDTEDPAHLYLMQCDARELATWPATARFDLIVSINTLHNLERDELAQVLRSISAMTRHSYITVDAWRTDEERERMLAWNLTAKTMMHVDAWRAFFAKAGYTGDFGWFIP